MRTQVEIGSRAHQQGEIVQVKARSSICEEGGSPDVSEIGGWVQHVRTWDLPFCLLWSLAKDEGQTCSFSRCYCFPTKTSPTVYQNWEILHSISSLLHLHHAKFALTLPPSVPVPIAVCVFFSNQESFFRRSNYMSFAACTAGVGCPCHDWRWRVGLEDLGNFNGWSNGIRAVGPLKKGGFWHLMSWCFQPSPVWVDSFVWGILSKLPFHLFIKKRKCHQ